MNIFNLILNNFSYYRKNHIAVLAGVVLTTAIITGALIVGDSIRYSLKEMSLSRLGNIQYTLSVGERFFSNNLSEKISKKTKSKCASLLLMQGSAVARGGASRSNKVSIVGIDSKFSQFWPKNKKLVVDKNEVVINKKLARNLGVRTGDYILVKLRKESHLAGDTPLGRDEYIALRLMVNRIIDNKAYGRFSLQTSQLIPNIAFIDSVYLAGMCSIKERANIILVEAESTASQMEKLQIGLQNSITLKDLGLTIKKDIITGDFEIKSDQVFLTKYISDIILKGGVGGYGVFSYFVNSISLKDKSTPYSFVAATGNLNIKDGEAVISRWLANDISAKVGDQIDLNYYTIEKMRRLGSSISSFKISKILPVNNKVFDSSLMPDFPGLTDSESCNDWDPSLPVDTKKIREKDEKYWEVYKGTSKMVVSLASAQKMWSNRFGRLTAVRFPSQGNTESEIVQNIVKEIAVREVGFIFNNVKEDALRASENGVDFGQLFIGLSFFIIVSALMLTALLFIFGIEMRSGEIGTLLALGFTVTKVRKILLIEGLIIALVGSIVGTLFGLLYNQLILFSLGSIWRDAVGASDLQTAVYPMTALSGFLISLFITGVSIYLTIRKFSLMSAHELQTRESATLFLAGGKCIKSKTVFSISILGILLMVTLLDPSRGKDAAGIFFGAGALMLTGCLSLAYIVLIKISSIKQGQISKLLLILKSISKSPKRSLTVIGLLAGGIFIVVAVASNRHDSAKDSHKVSSGSGGYSYYCESATPIFDDLNSSEGLERYGLDKEMIKGLSFCQIKVKNGDDASCLNMNRVSQPRLFGVDPNLFSKRKAFSFEEIDKGVPIEGVWDKLEEELAPGIIAGVADQGVIQWGLGKSVGDVIEYIDEFGEIIKVKLIAGLKNSIFQGSVLISESNMSNHFPSLSGYNVLLVDSTNPSLIVKEKLTEAFEDVGMEVQGAKERLVEFGAVENTYLTIFVSLGGLGVLIGTIGLGVVVYRNIYERRGQLAVLRAVGFSYTSIRNMLLSEHLLLLLSGVIIGVISAVVAILPTLLTSFDDIPIITVSIIILLIIANGFIWIWKAISSATCGVLIEALKEE